MQRVRLRLGSRHSRRGRHSLWFGPPGVEVTATPPFPLPVLSIYATGAILRDGGCRSAGNYCSRAEEHVARQHPWTDQLHLAVRKSVAGVTLGNRASQTVVTHRPGSSLDVQAAVGARSSCCFLLHSINRDSSCSQIPREHRHRLEASELESTAHQERSPDT